MHRPSWDKYFMSIADVVASRSTCDRAMVGGVLVIDNRIISTGYNGAPSGQKHCYEVGHMLVGNHCLRTIHAEQNCVAMAAKFGQVTKGATIYSTHRPCVHCAKLLISAGVIRVVYSKLYDDPEATRLFEGSHVKMTFLEG